MMIYDKFAEAYGWSPRVVDDELTLDEMFWLPVIRDAKAAAAEALRDKS
jgi:hypothetical protein